MTYTGTFYLRGGAVMTLNNLEELTVKRLPSTNGFSSMSWKFTEGAKQQLLGVDPEHVIAVVVTKE